MKILLRWDKEISETGKMYIPLVNGQAGRPTNDLQKAKEQAFVMGSKFLKKRQRISLTVLVYESSLSGFEENCDWASEADLRKEEKERAQYERLRAKFENEP